MKKLFLLLAFTGIIGAASASSITALSTDCCIVMNHEEEGKGKKGKKCCSKAQAAKCAKEGKTCSKADKKACAGKSSAGEASKSNAVKPEEKKAE